MASEGPADELWDDLRTTGETVEEVAERIARLEREKAKLQPGDPRVVEISAEVTRLAEQLLDDASVESELAARPPE